MLSKELKIKKHKLYKKNINIILILIFLLILTILISLDSGYIRLNFKQVFTAITGNGSSRDNLILFQFRFPRIVLSMLVGIGLSLSGCIIQNISRNQLAEPGILGINAGAGVMVLIYVLIIGSNSFLDIFTLPFLALIGAGITAFFIYILSFEKEKGILPFKLILTGVAVQATLIAFTTIMVVKLDDKQFNFVAAWQAGSIWGSNWLYVLSFLPWLIILIPFLYKKASLLDIINLGEETAYGLGVNVSKERKKLLIFSVALAASSVAFSGNINFVGLIAPHLSKKLVGSQNKILLPVCALIGALLMIIADTLARIIFQPKEIPTGIMVAIIGAPYFLYLLVKNKS